MISEEQIQKLRTATEDDRIITYDGEFVFFQEYNDYITLESNYGDVHDISEIDPCDIGVYSLDEIEWSDLKDYIRLMKKVETKENHIATFDNFSSIIDCHRFDEDVYSPDYPNCDLIKQCNFYKIKEIKKWF